MNNCCISERNLLDHLTPNLLNTLHVDDVIIS